MQLVVRCRCFFHKKFSSLYEAVRNWVWRDVQTQEVDVWGGWFFFPFFGENVVSVDTTGFSRIHCKFG